MSGGSTFTRINALSRTEQTVLVLTEMIVSGSFQTGQLLPSEHELCDRIGVSRSTLRLALRTLEMRGMIVTRHGVGAVVTDRTREKVTESVEHMLTLGGATRRDVFEVRLMLECQAASLAATRAQPSHIQTMRTSIVAMGDPSALVSDHVGADLAFHMAVADASGNNVLVAFVHGVRQLLLEHIAATFERDDNVAVRVQAHSAILRGIETGDSALTETMMREHLNRTALLLHDNPIKQAGVRTMKEAKQSSPIA